jgi:hypothetical protein
MEEKLNNKEKSKREEIYSCQRNEHEHENGNEIVIVNVYFEREKVLIFGMEAIKECVCERKGNK